MATRENPPTTMKTQDSQKEINLKKKNCHLQNQSLMPKRLGTADLDDLAAGATAQMSGEVSEKCECSAVVTSLPASKLYEVTKAVFSFAGDAGEGAVA